MPPKAKFTKEQVIQAALSIIQTQGVDTLTARSLAQKLGSSPRPIFTVFESMEQVQKEVVLAAKQIYNQYVALGLQEPLAFKGVGTQYIQFAIKEPKLFQLLFMGEIEGIPPLAGVLPIIDENYNEILLSVQKVTHLNKQQAQKLYHHLWIYSHGIATLCATRVCTFTPEQISNMLTDVFLGTFQKIREDTL